MKPRLAVAAITLVVAIIPARGASLLLTFTSPANPLGNSQVYGASPDDVTAYGYYGTSNSTLNAPTQLYTTNQGGDESGLGLSGDTTGANEIQTNDFIQIDFSDVEKLNITQVQFEMGGVQAGEAWAVYGSNTLGLIGAPITSSESGWGTADEEM